MKRLFIYVVMAMTIASCTNDVSAPGQDTDMTSDAGLSKASYLVGGGDQSRVRNYAYSAPAATRAGSGMQMPAYPTIPSDATELTDGNGNPINGVSQYKITQYHKGTINMGSGATLYIGENVNCEIYSFNSGCTVYIMKGATFTLNSGQLPSGVTIYNWGTFVLNGNYIEVPSNSAFYSDTMVELNGSTLRISGGTYYCKSTTYVKNIAMNSNVNVESCAFIIGDENDDDTYGILQNAGWLSGTENGVLNFEGGPVNFNTSYIVAGGVNFGSINLNLTLANHGLIETKYLYIDPQQQSQKIVTEKQNSPAVVRATNVTLIHNPTQGNVLPNFDTDVYLQDVQIIHQNDWPNKDYKPGEWEYEIPSGAINAEGISMTGEGCSPGYGNPGTPEGPTLDLVTEVKSPTTHDHDIDKTDEHRRHLSATSLTFDGTGNIYVSYHMRGGNWAHDTYDKDEVEGCIERWEFENGQIKIGNWMWTNEFDFNHIYLDEKLNRVVTVGHMGSGYNGKKEGGIIGRMPTGVWEQNWNEDQELTREDFVYKYLTTEVPVYDDYTNPKKGTTTNQLVDYESAGDGNCVIKVGNNYFVTTSKGYGILDSDFKRVKNGKDVLYYSTVENADEDNASGEPKRGGSAKYLVENNGDIYVLYLNEWKEKPLQSTKTDAMLATMKIDDFPTKGTVKRMKEMVWPVDGKNVIAVDNDVVYACLSMGGLQIGDSEPIMFGQERAVNGVAVYGDYIYVANGNYITVLDKTTHEKLVEERGGTEDEKISANFVEVKEYNGETYVFVAFGQNGIKVYKFNPAK